MAAFLASDFAWNINGQIFNVAGGTVSLAHHPLPLRGIYKPGMWTLDELDEIVPNAAHDGHHQPGAARPRTSTVPAGPAVAATEEKA